MSKPRRRVADLRSEGVKLVAFSATTNNDVTEQLQSHDRSGSTEPGDQMSTEAEMISQSRNPAMSDICSRVMHIRHTLTLQCQSTCQTTHKRTTLHKAPVWNISCRYHRWNVDDGVAQTCSLKLGRELTFKLQGRQKVRPPITINRFACDRHDAVYR